MEIRRPHIADISDRGKIEQIRNYLFYLSEQLELLPQGGVITTEDGWHVRYLDSRWAECWRSVDTRVVIDRDYDGIKGSLPLPELKYPLTFAKPPIEIVSVNSDEHTLWCTSRAKNTVSETGKCLILSPTATDDTGVAVTLHYYIKGQIT